MKKSFLLSLLFISVTCPKIDALTHEQTNKIIASLNAVCTMTFAYHELKNIKALLNSDEDPETKRNAILLTPIQIVFKLKSASVLWNRTKECNTQNYALGEGIFGLVGLGYVYEQISEIVKKEKLEKSSDVQAIGGPIIKKQYLSKTDKDKEKEIKYAYLPIAIASLMAALRLME